MIAFIKAMTGVVPLAVLAGTAPAPIVWLLSFPATGLAGYGVWVFGKGSVSKDNMIKAMGMVYVLVGLAFLVIMMGVHIFVANFRIVPA